MKRTLLLMLVAVASAPLAAQADLANGKKLYEQNCVACHARMVGGDGSTLFSRPDRRVNTLAGLGKQVRRCRDNLGLTWFDDQVNDVVDYLNATYYKLSK